MCYDVHLTGSVSLWIDTGFPLEKNETCTNRIGTTVDRSNSVPDRSKNRIDPVRSRVNATLYLVHFEIDLLPDRSRGNGV